MRRTITLIESQNGWLWAERGSHFKALASAQRSIAREDRALAKTHGAVITTITYVPNTPAGAVVVKALTTTSQE